LCSYPARRCGDARRGLRSGEAAEKEADRALVVARRAVKEAREEIRRLEKEAERE